MRRPLAAGAPARGGCSERTRAAPAALPSGSLTGGIRRSGLILVLPALLLAALLGAPVFAAKTDRIAISNGTEILGEVKTFDGGLLRISTDYMRTVYVDWEQVLRFESKKELEIELLDGSRYFGTVETGDEDRILVVTGSHGTVELPFDEIVQFTQTRTTTRIGKVDISLSAGLNFSSATDSTQVTSDSSIVRRTRKFSSSWSLLAIYSDTRDESFVRGDLDYHLIRHLPGRWTYDGTLLVQTNEQIGLEERYLIRGSAQYRTIRTATRELWLGAGLAGSRERFTADVPRDNSLELALSARYRAFHFDSPELSVESTFIAFPSLTTSGRTRVQWDTDFRRELVKDLFWSFAFYWSFDSQPVGDDAERSDLSIVGSIGWTW